MRMVKPSSSRLKYLINPQLAGGEGCFVDLLETNERAICHDPDNVVTGGVRSLGVEKNDESESFHSESAIRRDMRKEEHASTKAMAEKSGCLHIPPKGKQENFQKSNHPNYRYDLPEKNSVRDAFDVKMDKAIHESENTRISDDSSASREEIMEDLIGNGEDSRRQVFRTVNSGLYTEEHESGT
ncbi:hypothetical protein FXO38_08350 [Capsicum annuum]|nr:hypothetical protein FXO37_20932 [Capsicum annuum]KAF3667903.1 hypothetical protein FXO38_08350 [Capsicum annuum]